MRALLPKFLLDATVWAALSNFVTIGNIATFLGLVFGGFLVWRTGTTKQQQAITRQNEAAYRALNDGFSAATKRADAEKARADQQAELCAAWEVKNAELLRSAVADQTKYLVSMKSLAARVIELERAQGIYHDES
jgi:hypothetical protein